MKTPIKRDLIPFVEPVGRLLLVWFCGMGLLLHMISAHAQQACPRINEVVSANVTGLPDEYEADLSNCPVADCEQWYQDLGPSVWDGEYPDWIEIANPSDGPLALNGYGLSDDPAQPFKWVFPDLSIPARGFLVVFASGKNKLGQYAHTNFKLSSDGEEIILTAPSGTACDRVQTGKIPIDSSLGRLPGQPEQWVWFDQPTPEAVNSTPVFGGFQDEVRASLPAGFYPAPVEVSLVTSLPDSEIRFAWDGDEPGPEADLFSGPLRLETTRVLKARSFRGGRPASAILTATYLIGESFSYPVISLSTKPEHLWDPDLGIYTPGRNANESERVANYWQDWERPVHVEFFERNSQAGFAVDAGLQIFGWASRANPQKSFAVMLRDQYGQSELKYRLFPDMDVPTFRSFVLRAGGSDAIANGAFFRDPFASSLLKTRQLDVQAFRPVIVFLNGEYWGIQDLREKMNEDYLASHHGIDPDQVDMISRYWRRTEPVVIEGDARAYRELEHYLLTADLASTAAYEYLRAAFDLENFLDYTAAQIYFANYDWPGSNSKVWRARQPGARWRWLMFDLDFSFAFNPNQGGYTHNTLAHATWDKGTGWPNAAWTTFLIRSFLQVPAIRDRFINRMADLLNEDFLPETVRAQLDAFQALFEPEMPAHIARWAGTGNVIPSLAAWKSNLEPIRTFAQERPKYVRQHVQEYFGLSGTAEVRLVIDPPGAGQVKVNSLLIQASDWAGTYFTGVPIQLDVLPARGFRFQGWESLPADALSDEPRQSLSLQETLNATVRFVPDPVALNAVVINEINYNAPASGDPGDWIELHNASAVPVDVSGWTLKDDDESHAFTLPEETLLEPGGFLVFCSKLAAFRLRFPAPIPAIGDLGFNFGNSGDTLRLFDARKNLIDEVTYADAAPWPIAPDGGTATLSLMSPDLDNALPANWKASTDDYGTPGSRNRIEADLPSPEQLGVELVGKSIRIQFSTASGRQYLLQTSLDLRQWQNWEEITGTGLAITVSAPITESRTRFFRIQRLP